MKGATRIVLDLVGNLAISIHAPVKGVTAWLELRKRGTYISIHAPAKGATVISLRVSVKASYFNPRSREGSDRSRLTGYRPSTNFNPRSREGSDGHRLAHQLRKVISIHAPVKGATMILCRRCKAVENFNPRSREGSDK